MMDSCNRLFLGAVVLGLVCSSASGETNEPEELVSSPDFRSSELGVMPGGARYFYTSQVGDGSDQLD